MLKTDTFPLKFERSISDHPPKATPTSIPSKTDTLCGNTQFLPQEELLVGRGRRGRGRREKQEGYNLLMSYPSLSSCCFRNTCAHQCWGHAQSHLP